MKQITVKNLTLQFDMVGDDDPRNQAQVVIGLINDALSRSGLNSSPQFLFTHIDNSDIEVENIEEEIDGLCSCGTELKTKMVEIPKGSGALEEVTYCPKCKGK